MSASALPVPIVEQGLRQMAVLKLTDKDLPGPARFQDGVSHFFSFCPCCSVGLAIWVSTLLQYLYVIPLMVGGGGGRRTSEKVRGAVVHKRGRKYQHD